MSNNETQKIVNGKQFLKMGNVWVQTALDDCDESTKCRECNSRGNCPFFKERYKGYGLI